MFINIRNIILLFFIFNLIPFCIGQSNISISSDVSEPDVKIFASQNITSPDLRIKIGFGNAPGTHIYFGITQNKNEAQIIISEKPTDRVDLKILKVSNPILADISIEVSGIVKYPDFIVSYKEIGRVDFLIYYDKPGLPFDDYAMALLPYLNKMATNKYKILTDHFK